MSRRLRGAGILGALAIGGATVLYAVTDDEILATASYLGVLVGASIVAWIGAERAPHRQRLVPRLIAAGVSLSALGDVVWEVLDRIGADNDVSIADPAWFASYAVLCAALWVVLSRSRRGRRVDGDFVIDAVTIVTVSVLIFWSVSVDAIIADDSVTPFVRAVWASYPIADAVLLALVLRVLLSKAARAAIGPSFAAGVCLWLAADLVYLRAPEGHAAQVLMDSAWMIAPALMACAAWQASSSQPEVARPAAKRDWVPQLLVAVLPLFVPPVLELTADLRGQPDQPVLFAIGTTILIALAFARTARLLRSEERSQRELEVARDTALEASRAKSMFVANMSHEIRTPLTTVLATGELLEDTPLDDLQLHLLSKLNRSGEALKSLVEEILDFSRIEAGQLRLKSETFDLNATVAAAADVYRSRAMEAGLRFECRMDATLPHHVVGDSDRLHQVLTNLLDNAVKFTPHGQVTLLVQPVPGEETGVDEAALEFVVADTGIGIREEDQEVVFKSFHQVDGSTTRRYGGSGLGLAICKDLAEMMGGSITVLSQLGTGSTFVVRVPFEVAHLDLGVPSRATDRVTS